MNVNMDSLESVVAQIQAFSSSSSDMDPLHSLLQQSEELLSSHSSVRLVSSITSTLLYTHLATSISFLSTYGCTKNSLSVLTNRTAILSAPVSKEEANGLLVTIARFINSCSVEQIQWARERFTFICRRFKDQVLFLEAPIRGVAPMLTAIHKLEVSSEKLTTLHSDFLLLCLLAKCYKTGMSILEDDISEVDKPRDFFLYCYYGGMICIGQKQFDKALELLHNFSTSFPEYTSSVAQSNLKTFALPYLELANSYGNGNISELEMFVQTNTEKLENDNNLGLVKQVVSSMYKRNIQRLTQTYLTLSLQDIANTVQLTLKEAEMHVLQMIENGEIYAAINQKDGMVRFLEDPEQYKTCSMIEHIDSSIKRITVLSKKLTSKNELMSCDPIYLAKVGRENHRFDFDDLDSVSQRFNI